MIYILASLFAIFFANCLIYIEDQSTKDFDSFMLDRKKSDIDIFVTGGWR